MATHSSILARRTPWTEEPDGLQSTGVARGQTRLSDCHTVGIIAGVSLTSQTPGALDRGMGSSSALCCPPQRTAPSPRSG